MNEISTITSVSISNQEALQSAVLAAKAMQEVIDAFWVSIDQQMHETGVTSLKGDNYTISRAERKNWKVNLNDLPDYFKKPTADTAKLNAAFKAGETIPGADFSVSTYITKKITVEA